MERVSNEGDVERFLTTLLEKISSDYEPTNSSELCTNLIACLTLKPEFASMVGEILAALGGEELFRDEARRSNVLHGLVPFLSSPEISIRLQILRAVGNLCIDNDQNRESVLALGGIRTLTEQISLCSKLSSEESKNDRYKCVVCGCALNLAIDNEKVTQEFLCQGSLDKVLEILNIPNQNMTVTTYALQLLILLIQNVDSATLKNSKIKDIVLFLLSQDSGETPQLKLVLELIKTIIDKEDTDITLDLMSSDLVQQLMLIDETELQQQAMDLVVLFLREDRCMEVLFEDGNLLRIAKEWLTDSSSQLRMANASLIIANMARSDSNCVTLVQNGVVPLLIAVIKVEEAESMSGKLHHAALSALRNLSLPSEHKEIFLSMGVVDAAISALKISTMAHVHFKALGILRLLVEKQASTCSCVITEALERMSEVCEATSIPHVHIETGRLLSAIVKYCQDESIIVEIVKKTGMKWIYFLLEAEQFQLMSEGLLAMNIIAMLQNEEVLCILYSEIESSIVSRLSSILTSSFPLNLIHNTLVLLATFLSQGSRIKDLLTNSSELKTAISRYKSDSNEEIQVKAKEVLEYFL